jgi:hypothetical protein
MQIGFPGAALKTCLQRCGEMYGLLANFSSLSTTIRETISGGRIFQIFLKPKRVGPRIRHKISGHCLTVLILPSIKLSIIMLPQENLLPRTLVRGWRNLEKTSPLSPELGGRGLGDGYTCPKDNTNPITKTKSTHLHRPLNLYYTDSQ